jgi:tRNA(fMet)-specific endonuclease VapC
MPRDMLNTNMCIYLMKTQPAELTRRFAQSFVGGVVMSAITYAELAYGVSVAAEPERERAILASLIEDIPVVSFDGPIRLATRDSKKDHLNQLIATHAVALSVMLVTNIMKDFAKYPGVVAENWLLHSGHQKKTRP